METTRGQCASCVTYLIGSDTLDILCEFSISFIQSRKFGLFDQLGKARFGTRERCHAQSRAPMRRPRLNWATQQNQTLLLPPLLDSMKHLLPATKSTWSTWERNSTTFVDREGWGSPNGLEIFEDEAAALGPTAGWAGPNDCRVGVGRRWKGRRGGDWV